MAGAWQLIYPDLAASFSRGVSSGTAAGQAYRGNVERAEAKADAQRAKQAAAEQADQLGDARTIRNAASQLLAVKDNPEAYAATYRSVMETVRRERPEWAEKLPEQAPPPGEVQKLIGQMDQVLDAGGQAPEPDPGQMKARYAIAAELGRPELAVPGAIEKMGDPEITQRFGEYTRAASGIRTEADRIAEKKARGPLASVNVPVNVDARPLSKATATGEEKKEINARSIVQETDTLLNMMDEYLPQEAFGVAGAFTRLKGKGADLLGLSGEEATEIREKARPINRRLKQLAAAGNEIIKQLNGAGVMTDEDFKRHQKVFADASALVVGRDDLEDSLLAIQAIAERKAGRARENLREGIDLTPPAERTTHGDDVTAPELGGAGGITMPTAQEAADAARRRKAGAGEITPITEAERTELRDFIKQGLRAGKTREEIRQEWKARAR